MSPEMLELLNAFIVRAKANTYVGAGAPSASSRPGSHDLMFTESSFSYLDSYFGGTDFLGQEAVCEAGLPVWAMNYYGRILEPAKIDAAQTASCPRKSVPP